MMGKEVGGKEEKGGGGEAEMKDRKREGVMKEGKREEGERG